MTVAEGYLDVSLVSGCPNLQSPTLFSQRVTVLNRICFAHINPFFIK